MAISIVQLGSARGRSEGLRLGTVRRPPRGVKKADLARRGFYDVWLPELSPSAALVTRGRAAQTDAAFAQFARMYRREMSRPQPERLLQLLAALSQGTDFSVGCYCEQEARCHRSVLRDLLAEHGAKLR